jgi:hypothetical protein
LGDSGEPSDLQSTNVFLKATLNHSASDVRVTSRHDIELQIIRAQAARSTRLVTPDASFSILNASTSKPWCGSASARLG